MDDQLIISAYGSHNAAVSMYYKGEYTVVEVERWINTKNAGLTFYLVPQNSSLIFDEICDFLLEKAGRSDVDVYISGYMGDLTPKFQYKRRITCDHHMAHAAAAFYQSPYKESLVFTYDGGGDGGFFNAYLAHREHGITQVARFNHDLGFPYMILADYLEDIKKETLNIANLVYAGKLMGLCSYGNVREEWLPHFDAFYSAFTYSGDAYLGGSETRYEALPKLFKAIGVEDFDIETSRYSGQFAWDLAATTQRAFENQFFKYATPLLAEHPNVPVTLSGGCALNVLLNTKLLEMRSGEVFVPPNTNDCGISVGSILWYMQPETQVDLTYCGLPVLDAPRFSEYMETGAFGMIRVDDAEKVARLIADGKIVGLIQGNSEHGSRALGNRSIICNPVEGMKDTLNQKVKNREWYRPFAPIVRVEDAHKYFNFHGSESRHMVFVAEVRDEWKSVLPAITHEDGTGRLQTVTREQNALVYDIITALEPLTGHAVILNTSFNVNGKPILTTLADAFSILLSSKLDAIYYKGNLVFRKADERYFKSFFSEGSKVEGDHTSIVVMALGPTPREESLFRDKIEALRGIPGTSLTVMCVEEDAVFYRNIIPGDASLHTVGRHRQYYKKLIHSQMPQLKSTSELSCMLRLLWAKEVVRDDITGSRYHILLDIADLSIPTLLNRVNTALADVKQPHESESSLVAATESQTLEHTLGGEFYLSRFGSVPGRFYRGDLVAGEYDALNWLLTTYEGILKEYMSLRKAGSEADYLTISMMQNSERFRPYYE